MSVAPLLFAAAGVTQVFGVAAAFGVAAWIRRRDRARARLALDQHAARERARARRLLLLGVRRIEAAFARLTAENLPPFDDEPKRMLQSAMAVFDHALAHRRRTVPPEPIVTEALLGMRDLLQQGVDIADHTMSTVPILRRRIEPDPLPQRLERLWTPPPESSAEDLNAQRAPEIEWRLHTARRLLEDFDRGPPSV